ncbi:glycosyltransferase family 52 [Edwardsiella ictaluri]|uniref:glycosyltransferase family 52 n=1 Tax=Edwardsiella ictaluri TaxID=67780 RepID=UPI0018DBB9A0|nr:glycosyltransferase family 52 [Edwardsiella ictaluri]QPW29652.1 hypothetical protein F8539_06205 [Edwardsiella ictaluri]UYB62773.1 glycosyltransferase family 52 protein [Edwardsiella ictaluri]UYB65999.1 glycosyltransferase family 52 protein [Edwardsiella ictaluri]WJH20687.1 hypothetical protein FGU63_06220 [Edwardsiella ictaluri]BEH98443.1 glycosyltransferase family 52 [Edwardsiella ictaluri]
MNLYICLTPLQALIAEKIKEKQKDDGHLIYVSLKDNDVNKRAYNKIKKQMQLSFYMGDTRILWKIFRIFFILWGKRYKTVYVASIDSIVVHYALSYSKFERIETFDDGTLNISYDGVYYHDRVNPSLINTIAHKILCKAYDREKIQKNSRKHYSIYKGMRNIISNVELVDLFDFNRSYNPGEDNEISIFLGSVYKEICSENRDDLINKVLLFLKSKENMYYIPHPRGETNSSFSKYYLDSAFCCNDLAEFIVIRMLGEYSKINLYGFSSSAQFNLINVPGICCYVVKYNGSNKIIDGISDKLVKMGAETIVL